MQCIKTLHLKVKPKACFELNTIIAVIKGIFLNCFIKTCVDFQWSVYEMIIRSNLLKLSLNLCEFHSKRLKLINFNKYLVKYYSNNNNNNNNNRNNNNNNDDNSDHKWHHLWPEWDVFGQYQTEDKPELIPRELYKFNDSDDPTLRRLTTASKSVNANSFTDFEDELNFRSEPNGSNGSDSRSDQWFDIVSKAEQVVKYPTSFLSLRFLLKDEFSYLAIHLKRLIETKHPLLKTAKYWPIVILVMILICNCLSVRTMLSTNQQIRGLVVLLLSKAYSVPKYIADNYETETNRMAIISRCQRKLAEITDMIHVSQVLHRGVVDISDEDYDNHTEDLQHKQDLALGNTISVLIGDYLLAQASRGLALIRSPTVSSDLLRVVTRKVITDS